MRRTTPLVTVSFQIGETQLRRVSPSLGVVCADFAPVHGSRTCTVGWSRWVSEHALQKFQSLITGAISVVQFRYVATDAADDVYSPREERTMIFLNGEYCVRAELIAILFGVVNQELEGVGRRTLIALKGEVRQ